LAAFPAQPAEIAARRPNRLHPLPVFADYRKAANNAGFAGLAAGSGALGVQ